MTVLVEFFETPALLIHLVLVAVLAGLWVVSVRQRRRRLASWPRIMRLSDHQRRGWQVRVIMSALGLACLVIAMAGPYGGQPEPIKEVPGRDLMIVLDVSRSMAAEQPSRLDKAIRSLQSFSTDKRFPAGARVGLVVFGAQPWLAFPLTRDFEHLTATLDQFAAGEFPLEVRGDPELFKSGTRLGAALKLAAESVPARRPGRQDILLLSDGDDPEDDDEWLQGVTAARTSGLPVHVVAVGERGVKATIPYRGDVVRFEGDVVTTTVQSARLDHVAERTDGLSLTLERGDLPLASLIAKRWAETPPPDEANILTTPTDSHPVRRFPWSCAALLAFVIAHSGVRAPRILTGWHVRRVVAGLACLGFVSADAESAGMAELRRGQMAYSRQDFSEAIAWFEKAQPLLADPGLAAFNRAAAHYRLGQFGDAARAYRQALDDGAIADERRDRAEYDLGNSLLQQGGTRDRRLVEEAIAAYKRCLAGSPDAALKRDADFNLAIASQRLLKIQPPEDLPEPDRNPRPNEQNDPNGPDPANKSAFAPPKGSADPNGSSDSQPPGGVDPSKKTSAAGKSNVLPERPDIDQLTPEQIAAALAAHSERIARERRADRQTRDVLSPHGKDW